MLGQHDDISFEFFHHRSVSAASSLQQGAETLSLFSLHFISVTCSQNPTETLNNLAALNKLDLRPLHAHITWSSQENSQLPQYLIAAKRAGAKGIASQGGDGKSQCQTVLQLI